MRQHFPNIIMAKMVVAAITVALATTSERIMDSIMNAIRPGCHSIEAAEMAVVEVPAGLIDLIPDLSIIRSQNII